MRLSWYERTCEESRISGREGAVTLFRLHGGDVTKPVERPHVDVQAPPERRQDAAKSWNPESQGGRIPHGESLAPEEMHQRQGIPQHHVVDIPHGALNI